MGELVGEQAEGLRRGAGLTGGQNDIVAKGLGVGTASFGCAVGRLMDPYGRRIDTDQWLEETPCGLGNGHDDATELVLGGLTWRL